MSQRIDRGYSGTNYDRYVASNSHATALGKVQKQFWFTKSAVLRKFGKKEDEYISASDAELDAKIELFRSIEATTKELQILLADYQTRICVLAQEENTLGRILREYGKKDETRAGKIMSAVGKSLNYTAQQRVTLRFPLVRLFQDVDTFHTRAIEDTCFSVEELEKTRTEYRGALMWMKNVSQDFNPDQYQQLEKFREVQTLVKQKKSRFDQIKIKVLQKIELLAASRCNMFSHALTLYQNNIITFSEKTAKTFNTIASNFKGYEPYKFRVIKELAELPIPEEEDIEKADNAFEGDEASFFSSEYHDEDKSKNKAKGKAIHNRAKGLKNKTKDSDSDSLINLLTDDTANLSVKDNPKESMKNGNQKNAESFADIDLITDGSDSASNSDILKDLFGNVDVPESQIQQLPAFGQANSDPKEKSSDQTGQPSKPFLPSHLLDFGFRNLPSDLQESDTSFSEFYSASQPESSTSQSTSLFASANLAQQSQVTDTKPKPESSSNRPQKFMNKKKSKDKVDWFKAFQDIDPLSDPAHAIFGKGFDSKRC